MKRKIIFILLLGMAIASGALAFSCKNNQNLAAEDLNFNFYVTTTPAASTFAVLNTFAETDRSFLLLAQQGMFDQACLPPHADIIETEVMPETQEHFLDIEKVYGQIDAIITENPKSHITFYVDDENIQFFLDAAVKNQKLKYENVKLMILSSGSNSYQRLLDEVSKYEKGGKVLMGDEEIMLLCDRARAHSVALLKHYESGSSFLGYTNGAHTPSVYSLKEETEVPAVKSALTSLTIGTQGYGFEIESYYQFPEFFSETFPEERYPKFHELLKQVNFKKYSLSDHYGLLDENGQKKVLDGMLKANFLMDAREGYYEQLGKKWTDVSTPVHAENKNTHPFDKAYMDALFKSNTGKKNLMVVHARPDTARSPEQTEVLAMIARIAERYHADYNLFWKEHPGRPLDNALREILADKGFSVLPGKLPSALLLKNYPAPNLYLGGWAGSTWYDASEQQPIFFIDEPDPVSKILFQKLLQEKKVPVLQPAQ